MIATIESDKSIKQYSVSAVGPSIIEDGEDITYAKSCRPGNDGKAMHELSTVFNGARLTLIPFADRSGNVIVVNGTFTADRLIEIKTYAQTGCSVDLPTIDSVKVTNLSFTLREGDVRAQTLVDQRGTRYKVQLEWRMQ
ncbi:hypothetical protein [Paracidovorax citrulli]